MQSVSTILVYLALAGAFASWIAGAVFYARTLRALGDDTRLKWLAVVAWPFAISRLKGAAAEPAANLNKARVAFIACLMIGAAAFSASTNLHRFAK
ncbi:MAG: hypothetical protein QOG38_233 [Hyphomicrobiales bacterium]|nr:hypothetical protein [Hyphomicrobiales bacterium]